MDDQRRRYYRLSNMGQKVLSAESQRLEQAVNIARQKRVLVCL
jgi:hypothetical protein